MDKVKNFFGAIGRWFKNWFVPNDNNTTVWGRFIRRDSGQSIVSALVCIVIGLLIGFVTLLVISPANAVEGFVDIFRGFYNMAWGVVERAMNRGQPIDMELYTNTIFEGLGMLLTDSLPLILCGLAIVFAYKAGMFNIGVAGQFVAGILFTYVGAIIFQLPWYLCLIFAMLGGALWGALPGLLKAVWGVNEVITGIMFNWIVLYVTNGILRDDVFFNANLSECHTFNNVAPNALIPTLGLDNVFGGFKYIGAGLFITIIVAIGIWLILNKTKLGYEVKATGANKNAALYAGMNQKRNIVLTMAIAGGLAALGAGIMYLSGRAIYNPLKSFALPAMGFDGIAVGFLGALSPVGTIFSSIFITHIKMGGGFLSTKYYSPEIADLITSIIIYACGFSAVMKILIGKIFKNKSHMHNSKPESVVKSPKENVEGGKQ